MKNTEDQRDTPLEIAILGLRAGLTILFLIWAVDKIVNPGHTKAILGAFYGTNVEALASYIPILMGVAQLVLVGLFASGIFKTFSYGLIFLMHLVSTVVSMKMHLDPFGTSNILFWANWPILGAAFALFMLRARDKMLTVGARGLKSQ